MRIGGGAGFAGDRIAPAVDLVERGALDFVVLECLAERTIALGQRARLADPDAGYEPRLDRWVQALAGPLARTGTRAISNFGSANPRAAARRIVELGAGDVAVVTGDDVLDRIDPELSAWEDGRPLAEHGELVSANAYLGADALADGLASGARWIVTGRVADPSLFVAPIAAGFAWEADDWDRLARATTVGHLLECGAQVTGGYFADPPLKPVPGLARVGCPIAEVAPDGSATLTKLPGTGGRIDRATIAEQLTYEVTDPAAYVTPDVIADFTSVRIAPRIDGARGHAAPGTLKVSVGYRAGFRCEAEISYAGRNALARARLAGELVAERLAGEELRIEVLGDTRLRVAAIRPGREGAEAVGEEVAALYTNGPAGGGGLRVHVEEVIGILSTTIPREAVDVTTELVGR